MMFKQTIAETREEIGRKADALTAQLEETSDLVVIALVVIGCVAAAALVFSLTADNTRRR